ncbi:MAG: DUF6869 domain-containing protein [Acidimicrobiales bacterium]
MDDEALEAADSPMQRFVDAEDIDGLLRVVSADDIAMAWHRYTAVPEPKSYDHQDWWAIELFMGREIFQRTELHRHLLLKLVEHGPEDAIGAVGAGPLEDFVSDDEDDLRWLEDQCTTNQRLQRALRGVWSASYVSAETLARLDAAAGEQLPRPRPESEWLPELLALLTAERRLDDVAGGLSEYQEMVSPTDEQQAAAEAYGLALRALLDRRSLQLVGQRSCVRGPALWARLFATLPCLARMAAVPCPSVHRLVP